MDKSLPSPAQLLDAAELGDMATLRSLLAAHPDLAKPPLPDTSGPASAPTDLQVLRQVTAEERLKAIRDQHRRLNRQGATPLYLAALGGHLEASQLLVEAGADVNARDSADRTPMYEAVVSASVPIVSLLLAHRADPNVRSRSGLPLDIAQRMLPQDAVGGPYQTIAQMLTKAGAKTSPPNSPPHP